MNIDQLQSLIRERVTATGISERQASMRVSGRGDLIQGIKNGSMPSFERACRLLEVLGVNFRLEAQDAPEDLYLAARDTDQAPPAAAHLRDIESHTQGLVRVVAAIGGDPIPDDLREGLLDRHRAEQDALTSPFPPENVVEFPGARSGARPVDVVEVAAAAGGGATELDERVTGCVWFRRDWLDRNAIDPTQSVVISVHGESMEPLLPDGSSVLVDRTRRRRSAGRVFVLQTAGGLVIKRLEQYRGVWQLMSEHPDWAPMPWTNGTEIIGEVRWTARTLE